MKIGHLFFVVSAVMGGAACGGTATIADKGGTGGAGGVGGASDCPAAEVFEARIGFFDAVVADNCVLKGLDGQAMDMVEFEGVLMNTGVGRVQIDGCPQKNCESPILHDIEVNTHGVAVEIPDGSYVHVRYGVVGAGNGCGYALSITNIESIEGMPPNPVEMGTGLWFYGSESGPDMGGAVKAVMMEEQMCGPGYPMGYGLRLSVGDDASKVKEVAMGETGVWVVETGMMPGSYMVKDLASLRVSAEKTEVGWVVARGK